MFSYKPKDQFEIMLIDLVDLSCIDNGSGSYIEYSIVKDWCEKYGFDPIEKMRLAKKILMRIKG